jgi:hypothetical protein
VLTINFISHSAHGYTRQTSFVEHGHSTVNTLQATFMSVTQQGTPVALLSIRSNTLPSHQTEPGILNKLSHPCPNVYTRRQLDPDGTQCPVPTFATRTTLYVPPVLRPP